MLDVPRDLIWFVSDLLAARRRSIGTRKKTRSLGCYRHALFGLAWFRDKGSIPRLGAGFGLSQATSYRYIDEIIDVLAGRAPGLREALERALAEGAPYVILDGKIVDSDRCHEKTLSRKGREIDLWYSGKKKDFGGNIQALFYPDGKPMWVSDVLPGNVNDLAAARESVLADTAVVDRDLGYVAAGHDCRRAGASGWPDKLVTQAWKRGKVSAAAVIMPVCGTDQSRGSRCCQRKS